MAFRTATLIQLLLLPQITIAFLLLVKQSDLLALGFNINNNSPCLQLVTDKIIRTRHSHNNNQRIINDIRPFSSSAFLYSSKAAATIRSSSSKPFTHKKMNSQKDTGVEVLLQNNDDILLVSDDSSSRRSKATAMAPSVALDNTCTLAGDYLIECNIMDSSCQDNNNNEDNDDNNNKMSNDCYYTWTLVPLSCIVQDLDPAFQKSAGATAWAALYSYSHNNKSNNDDLATTATRVAALSLQCRVSKHDNSIHVTVIPEKNKLTADEKNEDMLIAVLARVLAQWTLALEEAKKSRTVVVAVAAAEGTIIHWPDDATTTLPAANKKNEQYDDDTRQRQDQKELVELLYKGVFDMTTTLSEQEEEVVEMVDHQGLVLGRVPRKLVHQYNILHRGIGMFVTRDRPIMIPTTTTAHYDYNSKRQQQQQQPDLYVHQRTATKRIFPSLYDMFVGGVALAGESSQLTACREVAEELGLGKKALQLLLPNNNEDNNNNISRRRLSDCILTCTICTAYNRCVVDLFTYTMDTTMECVSWQEQEVAWGDFVPYHIVEAAADLSIQRLVNCNKWPGMRYPPIIQSHHAAAAQEEVHVVAGSSATTTTMMTTTKFDNEEWKTWDFVPDGLLVWEAWLQFLEATKE